MVEWEIRFISAPTDCKRCEFAFELEHGPPFVEIEVGGACGPHEAELAAIEGTRTAAGYGGGEALWGREGEIWVERGYAEYVLQDMFFVELEPE